MLPFAIRYSLFADHDYGAADHGRAHTFTINFGPQHPAAHGVLRLVLELTARWWARGSAYRALRAAPTIEQKTYRGVPYSTGSTTWRR